MRFAILALTLVAASPWQARAQGVEITPVVGFRFGGGNLNTAADGGFEAGAGFELRDGESFGLRVGYAIGEGELELLYGRQNTALQSAELFGGVRLFDIAVESWQLAGNVLFGEERARARPFVGLGIGLTRLLPKPAGLSDETRFSFSLGGGIKLFAGSHLGLRLEGRWLLTLLSSDSGSRCVSGSCTTVVWTSQALSQADLSAGLIVRF